MATAKTKQPSSKPSSKGKAPEKKTGGGKAPARTAAKKTPARNATPKKAVSKQAAGKAAGKNRSARAAKGGRPASKKAAPQRAAPTLEHMDDRTLAKIIEKLEEMREESRKIVNSQLASDMRPREENQDVGDDLDQASNERDREFNLIMHQRHLRRLQQIEEAYERIEEGTYGLCEGTEEPINPKRLLIMPLARFSLEYQEQQEKMLGRSLSEGFQDADVSFGSED